MKEKAQLMLASCCYAALLLLVRSDQPSPPSAIVAASVAFSPSFAIPPPRNCGAAYSGPRAANPIAPPPATISSSGSLAARSVTLRGIEYARAPALHRHRRRPPPLVVPPLVALGAAPVPEAVELATPKSIERLAAEAAVRWIIPAVAVKILISGFGGLFGFAFGRGGRKTETVRVDGGSGEDEALAALLAGDGPDLASAMFYNEEMLEDIALGTNLGPFSPNGYVQRRYGDGGVRGGREGRSPIRRVWDWLWGGRFGDGDGGDGGTSGSGNSRWWYRDRRIGGAGRRNPGLPETEYLRVDRLNERLDSYGFSVEAAVRSRAVASSGLRDKNFGRVYGLAVRADSSSEWSQRQPLKREEMEGLLGAETLFLQRSKSTLGKVHACDRAMRDIVIKNALTDGSGGDAGRNVTAAESVRDAVLDEGERDDHLMVEDINVLSTAADSTEEKEYKAFLEAESNEEARASALMLLLSKYNRDLVQHELDFISSIVKILGPDRAPSVRAALLHTSGPAGRLISCVQDRPLKVVLGELGYTDRSYKKKSLFVCDFPGDISASRVKMLREEVTGIVRSASPGDEALVVLKSGGGSVTGYGLAAGQLLRLQEAGIPLTICVEEQAASGGYMMCCVADKIVASPFAVLGSIGVLAEVPNVFERLKREGVEVQTVTAGKYKRVLTRTKKNTQKDFDKAKEEVEEILFLFKRFVKKNRPSLDLEEIATGETWFGEDALEKGLCDAIATKDDVLLEYVEKGYDVFNIRYEEPKEEQGGLRDLLPIGARGQKRGLLRHLVREIVSAVKEEATEVNLLLERPDHYLLSDRVIFADPCHS